MSPITSEHASTSPETPALPEHASPASTGLPNDASNYPSLTQPSRKRSPWPRILLLILAVAAVAFVVYRIRTNKPPSQGGPGGGGRRGGANQITPVAFDVATTRTIPISLTALGTVTAYNTVTLKSRVDGQITKVNFREGQRVRQGELLIEIDQRPYQAALSIAQGNLARDQANAALAQVQSQRYNQLYAAGVVSAESTQTQEATAGQSVGTLEADRAAIQQAQVNLNYTRITSPINGIVGLRQVDVGNIVTAAGSTGLVVITQVQPISVIFTLPEDQLPQVFEHMRGGHILQAEAWDRADVTKITTGSLLTVDNQIDTTTGTAKLKAVFNNADNALFPNQFVNIHLILEDRANSLVIPAAAIQTGNMGSFVYVIDRSQPQAGAPGGATQGRPAGASNRTLPTGGPSGGPGGGNTEPSNASSDGASTDTAVGAPPRPGTTVSGRPGAGGRRAGGNGVAGGNGGGGGNVNYPVRVVPVVIDSTQGTQVIIKSGLQAGQQVVTDGQERLQPGSRVIPRPSAQMVAARQARANGNGQNGTSNNKNPDAGNFSNGRNSDRDAAGPGSGQQHGHGGNTGPNDTSGTHRGSGGENSSGAPGSGAPNGANAGHHKRPGGANP